MSDVSVEALKALYDGRATELPTRLAKVDAKRRPSHTVAMTVLGYVANRLHRGYVDETVEQVAIATGLRASAVKACLGAFDEAGITVVVRRSQPGSAPRREVPFLAEQEAERGGVDPAVMADAERGGVDPAVSGVVAPVERGGVAVERGGVDAERGGVAVERGGVSPAPPPVFPPVFPPLLPRAGVDREAGDGGSTQQGRATTVPAAAATEQQPPPPASGAARREAKDLEAAAEIARAVYKHLEHGGWNDSPDHERRSNSIASIVGYCVAVLMGRRWFEIPPDAAWEPTWAAVCDALTAPLGFKMSSADDVAATLREAWGRRAEWTELDRDEQLAVLADLRLHCPSAADDLYDPFPGHLSERVEPTATDDRDAQEGA